MIEVNDTHVKVLSLLTGESGLPLQAGGALEALGSWLGIPDWWNFGSEDYFLCTLGYKDCEIECSAHSGRVLIDRIQFILWEAKAGKPVAKSKPIGISNTIELQMDFLLPGSQLETIAEYLLDNNISFEDLGPIPGSEVVNRLKIGKCSTLMFFSTDQGSTLMEIEISHQ